MIKLTPTRPSSPPFANDNHRLCSRLCVISCSDIATYSGTPTSQTYSYDPNGNRLSMIAGSTTTYGYSATGNALLTMADSVAGTATLSYDADGELTQLVNSSGSTTYANNAHRLAAVTQPGVGTTSFYYNALGERSVKSGAGVWTGVNAYLTDNQGHILGQYKNDSGAVTETIWMGDKPVGMMQGGLTYFVNPDYINAAHSITDGAGNVDWAWDRDPCGNNTPYNVGYLTFYQGFPGQSYDPETGTYHNGFRDAFATGPCRYSQPDPIGMAGASLATMSLYPYAAGNPVGNVDRNGLQIAPVMPMDIPMDIPWLPEIPAPNPIPISPSVPMSTPAPTVSEPALSTPNTGAQNDLLKKKNECIEKCYSLLERPKQCAGSDLNTFDFQKCVNECMGY